MLLIPNENLEEIIVRYLAKSPGLSALTIHERLNKSVRSCSLKAIYKALGVLEIDGVVFKVGKAYSLKTPWVLDFLDLAASMEQTYLREALPEDVLPTTGKRKFWSFPTIAQMDRFWTHVLTILFANSGEKNFYDYVPHAWFLLIHHSTEGQFLDAIKRLQVTHYRIIGGRSWLDHQTDQFYKHRKEMRWSYSASPFESERAKHIGVIGDYILTIEIEGKKAHLIDDIYKNTTAKNPPTAEQLLSIFFTPSRATVRLTKDRKKARVLKGKFERYFGVVNKKVR